MYQLKAIKKKDIKDDDNMWKRMTYIKIKTRRKVEVEEKKKLTYFCGKI